MPGAGVGGCTVAIIKEDDINNYIDSVVSAFRNKFKHDASFYVTEIGNGGREI